MSLSPFRSPVGWIDWRQRGTLNPGLVTSVESDGKLSAHPKHPMWAKPCSRMFKFDPFFVDIGSSSLCVYQQAAGQKDRGGSSDESEQPRSGPTQTRAQMKSGRASTELDENERTNKELRAHSTSVSGEDN
jgi:hypothetical protein